MRKRIALMIMQGLLLCWAGASPAADRVRLQLRWTHQFQFAGYYVALERGLYAAEGLDVELVEGGPAAPQPVEAVLAGEADFAVTGSGAVIHYLGGKPVVAVAAVMQTSPVVWLVRDDAGIFTPHDLVGRRLMLMPGAESAELLVTLRREGIAPDRVQLLPTSFDLDDLIDRRVDAFDAYVSNEPFAMQRRGVGYRVISPREYGTNFYGDVLVTSKALAERDPEKVQAFVRASLAGWRHALENVDETIALIRRDYAPMKSEEHLRYEAGELQKLIMPELVQLGHMNPGRWQFIADSYVALGFAEAPADIDGFLFAPKGPADYRVAWLVLSGALALVAVIAAVAWRFVRLSRALAREITQRQRIEQKLRDSNATLEQLATTDRLTGLLNRRKFEELATIEIGRARRYANPLALLFLDIDHFKAVNDHYGHPTGDIVLAEMSQRLRASVRQSDSVGRWGGEEFLILAPGASRDEALRLAEKLRAMVAAQGFRQVGSLTISIGVSTLQGDDDLQALVSRADAAMYRAKQGGRNRVELESKAGVAG